MGWLVADGGAQRGQLTWLLVLTHDAAGALSISSVGGTSSGQQRGIGSMLTYL